MTEVRGRAQIRHHTTAKSPPTVIAAAAAAAAAPTAAPAAAPTALAVPTASVTAAAISVLLTLRTHGGDDHGHSQKGSNATVERLVHTGLPWRVGEARECETHER